MRPIYFGLLVSLAFCANGPGSAAETRPFCASDTQIAAVREAYDQMRGALPHVVARKLNLPEVTVVSALPEDRAVGTTGESFAKIWKSLTDWERPATVIKLDANSALEVFAPIGRNVDTHADDVHVSPVGSGVGGIFTPQKMEGIFIVSLTRSDGKIVHGALFYGPDGKDLFGVYSIDSPKDRIFGGRDPYENTRELVKSLPPLCHR